MMMCRPFTGDSSALLELKQKNTEREEDSNPHEDCDEAEVDFQLGDTPALLQHTPQRFSGVGQWQEHSHQLQPCGHALNGPDNSAEHDNWQETPKGHISSCAFGVTSTGHHKSKAHATETIEDDEDDHKGHITVQGETKEGEGKQYHQQRLTHHYNKLRGDVREEDFHSSNPGY